MQVCTLIKGNLTKIMSGGLAGGTFNCKPNRKRQTLQANTALLSLQEQEMLCSSPGNNPANERQAQFSP